jgi:benzoate-CoA ligase family protein
LSTWPETLNADDFFLRDRLREGREDRVALRLDDRDVTYGQVDQAADSYASALIQNGVRPGDRVLIVMPDGLGYVGALFGTLRVGATVVMLNPGLTPDAMGAIVDLSDAHAAVVGEAHLKDFRRALRSHHPSEIVGDPPSTGPVETHATAPQDPAIWLFSGGTTGLPKTVPQTHKSLVNTTKLYGQGTLGLTEDDVTIAVPKLFFGYATGSNLLFPFSVGASAVLFEAAATPAALFERIARHKATVLVHVPSAVNQMLRDPHRDEADLSSLRLATSAGEALPDTLYKQWKDVFGVELLDGLGTAEMWHIFVSNRIGDVRPGTLGRVVEGFEIKVCDDTGEEVPVGEVGRLWVRGDSLGLGYQGDPEQTAAAFRGEWFAGGDLVSIDEDGYVTHRGRGDDAIKVKGRWFRPQELESVLLDHPLVDECAVVAIEDDSGLSRPVAYVVSRGHVTESELIDWSLSRLEAYKHPRSVHFLGELPKTHLGKVDRGALRRLAD